MTFSFLRLLVRRWVRRPGGQMAGALVLVTPLVLLVASWLGSKSAFLGAQFTPAAAAFLATTVVALISTLCLANLTAAALHDERRDGRGRLLRACGFDGAPPAMAFLLFGLLQAILYPILGFGTTAAFALPVVGGSGSEWLAAAGWTGFALATMTPLVVAGAYLLPRGAGLVFTNVLALSAFVPILGLVLKSADAEGPQPRGPATLGIPAVGLCILLPFVWKRTSARLWT